jgi:hypothetical protein
MSSRTKLLLLLPVLLLSGCAHYQARRLRSVPCAQEVSVKGISVAAHALTIDDCKTYLGRNVIKAGYRPIYINIKNESPNPIEFNLDALNVRTVDAEFVAHHVGYSPLARGLAYGIPSILFLWPLAIPAFLDSQWAHEANAQLHLDYLHKSLVDSVIPSHAHCKGLIFVWHYEYKDMLKITFVDKNTREPIVCNVRLER